MKNNNDRAVIVACMFGVGFLLGCVVQKEVCEYQAKKKAEAVEKVVPQ